MKLSLFFFYLFKKHLLFNRNGVNFCLNNNSHSTIIIFLYILLGSVHIHFDEEVDARHDDDDYIDRHSQHIWCER